MKRFFLVLSIFFIAGCAISLEREVPHTDLSGVSRRFITFRQVHNGMSEKEVESVLGSMVIVGYELQDAASEQYKPMTVRNPVRREKYNKGGRVYDVVYYLAGIKSSDGKMSDDEMVPLVFLDGKLVGSGWDFLDHKVKGQ